jgi:retron-type reverse transcriptase
VDGERFDDIEEHQQAWLAGLQQELRAKRYAPRPLLRVWIPKANGGERPLGIPIIRDRVVQMAVLLVIGPIFEVDLLPWQYGFRPGMDAKMALRRATIAAKDRGDRQLTPTHILIGILRAREGTVPRTLAAAGVDPAELAAHAEATLP